MSEPPVVSALIETFTSMLADKVLEEVSLITGFKMDFEFLCDELLSVKLLLDEAGQNSTSRSMSNWLEKLEYFLIDAVDIVDECRESKFGNSIFTHFEKLIFRRRMGSKIRTLKERINNIHRSAKYLKHLMLVLQVNALNVHKLEDKRERSSDLLKESQIVGMKDSIDNLTKSIMAKNCKQVIVVVGMGGMGKTLLVRRVVESQKVQERFGRVVSLPVSQSLDMQHLLPYIARKMKLSCAQNHIVPTGDMSVQSQNIQDIQSKILEDLEKRGCLFVLDDLWNKDDFHKFKWLWGKTTIVVTTRNRRVVDPNPAYDVHEHFMERLSVEDSMKLFCIHAFPDREDTQHGPADTDNSLPDQIPEGLATVASQTVQKCGAADTDNSLPNQTPEELLSVANQTVPRCGAADTENSLPNQIPEGTKTVANQTLQKCGAADTDSSLRNQTPEELATVANQTIQKCGVADIDNSLPNQTPEGLATVVNQTGQNCGAADANNSLRSHTPEGLATITKKIVKKCDRLPLALKTVGAYMAKERRLPNAWESVLDSLNEAEAMSDQVMPSLRLSYHALPYHLKLCFDYCSSFPKNSRIKSEYLVNAWIYEGFTPQTTENPYDVGISYIDELIDRCLLEVEKVGGDGRVKYCKMHDLLNDLAHSESRKKAKCLLMPAEELQEFPVGKCVGLRRISLVENNISKIDEPIKCPGLRTLLLRNNVELTSFSPRFFDDTKYLGVLALSGTAIDSLPETVGQLKHLRFLNLSNTKIAKLPNSLAELRSLQFLDVSLCEHLREMHSGIGKHKSMLHLNVKGSDKLESLPVGISNLLYLHTLKGPVFKMEKEPSAKAFQLSTLLKRGKTANVKALQWRDLEKLTRLQHLSLTLISEGSIRLEDGTFKDMEKMRALSFKYIDSSEGSRGILHLPKDIQVMQRLEILHLKGCVLQDWIFRLQNLMELELHGDNGSTPDHYNGLQNIPNLRKLKLSSNDKCVEFPQEFGTSGAFPRLETFVIKSFDRLKSIPSLQDGALPMLKCLQMKYCKQLKDITKNITKALKRPSGILEEIRVKECSEWEDGIWKDNSSWQLLKGDEKDRPIKLTINGYTVSWAENQSKNKRLSGKNFKERESLRLPFLVMESAFAFKDQCSTSSAGGVAVERNLQNDSGVECGQRHEITMDEHKEKNDVAGVTGLKKGEQVSSSNGHENSNNGNFPA